MAMLVWLILLCIQIKYIYGIQCLSQSGSPVDWFVVYKIPKQQDNKDPNLRNGTGFYYMDKINPRLVLSDRGIDDKGQAIYNTLNQVYHNKTTIAYIMYNDQTPNNKSGSNHGHTKGIVAMDTSGGFWIVHSTPKFPPFWSDGYKWAENGYTNGQTFLCISMAYSKMDNIGTVLMYTYPLIYDKSFPDVFVKDNPTLASIVRRKSRRQIHVTKPPWYTVKKLTTRNDDVFFSFAKYTNFERDLYDGLMSSALKEDLLVQSWIESEKSPGDKLPSNCTIPYKVYNINSVQIPGTSITFPTSKDHSKWAVSKQSGNWLCIGDINRQKPQFHRGGGQLCFQNEQAWKSFRTLVKDIETC